MAILRIDEKNTCGKQSAEKHHMSFGFNRVRTCVDCFPTFKLIEKLVKYLFCEEKNGKFV